MTARHTLTAAAAALTVALALAVLGWFPATAAAEEPSATAAAAETRSELSQYGITWTLAAPARVGRFVTGDWWVVGPVTVQSVTPEPAPGRHGSAVNPPAGKTQGYDDRMSGYDASLRATFPLELRPGQSLVSTASLDKVGDKTPDTVPGQYARGPLRTAVVLTCVAEPPAADAFRPAYVGADKPAFRVGQLRRDLLPKLKTPGVAAPAAAQYERFLQRIWLDHQTEWPNRMMHPLENMPDYGREITNITSTVSLMLMLDDPEKQHDALLLQFVQLGIDYYGAVMSDNDLWVANGGHNSGRKIPIIVAGVLLDHDGMKHVRASFAEGQQTYFGENYRGQKALWKIDTGESRKHEHLPPDKWQDPPFKGDNDGWKSEAYRDLNGPTWVAQALAARLLGAKGYWNHDAYFDYVDRWVAEGETGGLVDKATKEPKTYNPFPSDFVKAMWTTYRATAGDNAGPGASRSDGRTFRVADGTATVLEMDVTPVVENDFSRRFRYDSFDNPKLQQLRKEQKLDQVVAGGKDEFDRQVRLLDWVHHRFKKFGTPTANPRGALDIFKAVDEGHTFFCSYYASSLVSCTAAMGWVSRSIGLHVGNRAHGRGAPEHSITEIWSNQHNKWVLFDPTYALYVERDGLPLSGWEIRQEWFYGDPARLDFVIGKERKKHKAKEMPIVLSTHPGYGELALGPRTIDKLAHMFIIPNNDLMDSAPDYAKGFILKDDKLSEGIQWHRRDNPANPATEPYFPLGQVDLNLSAGDGSALNVQALTHTPNFQTFRYRFNGEGWIDGGEQVAWPLRKGRNTLEAVSVNRFGVEGHPSKVVVEVK